MREGGAKLPVGGTTRVALALFWALTQVSCVLLPVRVAPGVSGFVTDAESGEPIADAMW